MGACFGKEVHYQLTKTLSLKENRLSYNQGDVFEKYEKMYDIGSGAMGSIACVRRRNSKKKYALKTIHMGEFESLLRNSLLNEISIIRSLDHPNIVKAYEVFRQNKNIYLIMQVLSGGDLNERKPYTELQSKKILKHILSAVKYMHNHGVIHRDLKFENIMFENNSPDAFIQVIDFGLSARYNALTLNNSMVGTILTMSPQVLEKKYSKECDLWSVGVIAYTMLSGKNPFHGCSSLVSIEEVTSNIRNCSYCYKEWCWHFIGKKCKNFISSLIVYEPEKRLTADEALKHDWLHFDVKEKETSLSLKKKVNDKLLSYANYSEVKKLALLLIAHKSKSDDIVRLRKVFTRYDPNNSGDISLDEFKDALCSYCLTDEELEDLFNQIDIYNDGVISYTEFLAATIELDENLDKDRILDAFNHIDCDNTGFITKENFKVLFGINYSEDRVNRIFDELNLDSNSSKISGEDFSESFWKECDKCLRLSKNDEIN